MLSRVADSLYWMSRYLERAEHTARLVDVDLHGLIDQDANNSKKRHDRLLETLNFELVSGSDNHTSRYFIKKMVLDRSVPNSIVSCIASARENARHVREEISSEMWEELNRLYLFIIQSNAEEVDSNPHLFLTRIKSQSLLFQGITDSTLSHAEGWHFIHIGKYLERVSCILRLLEVFLRHFEIGDDVEIGSENYYDWIGLMKSCTAYEAYCRSYRSFLSPPRMTSYLLLDPDFPHSIRSSINFIRNSLTIVSELTQTRKVGNVNRLIGKMGATLDYTTIDDVKENPVYFLRNIQQQCNLLHDSIYTTYISYPVETGI